MLSAAAAACAVAAGCTFLVSFDDVPSGPDAAAPVETPAERRDSGPSGPEPEPEADAAIQSTPVPVRA